MKKYTQLSKKEREQIYSLIIEGFSKKEIANIISRSPSTISREIKRNSSLISQNFNHLKQEQKTKGLYHYLPDSAQLKRNKRRKLANYRPPLKNPTTFKYVIQKLKEHWSPDIIAGVLKKKYKTSCQYTISHETIYKFIYTKHGEELGLKNYLTRRHKTRRKYTGRKTQKLPKIPNRLNITERQKFFPKSETRKEFGHFEGDSILSVRTTFSAIHTEVERKTRFIFAQKINKKSAENVEYATIRIFSELPKNSIKSTTWDNGTEHTNHQQVTEKTGITIFFAEPYKSWQRGTNEHANGMIRRYFPKGTNFDEITENQLQEVVQKLNNRPRKILNYRTSQELFDEELKKFTKFQ